ncbi:acyltransferase [Persicimonas caeni]|uniref:Acyltransferase n=1 Tax=Persicimonas caeni TaxID=2292766 RepID=A0A4Y6PZ83_PERCE|nr:lysophospholipid acyltransferase family protein [Persicimonas caeni]QDG53479.1 acyltransferase [Persicimonas caeni]QED34700.1 acyltransferase [Persicimonas caeni]
MFELLAKAYLAATGWTVRNDVPDDVDKFVIIAAPHTSNWDFPVTLAVAKTIDMKFYWVGKHTLFRWPFGGLMRRLGGIPIDRRSSQGFVEQIAEAFDDADAMALGIAPEGTRSKRDHWKSGFYHIAREAGVPIVLGFLDWGRKEGGLGPMVDASQSKKEVMDQIRAFYADKEGKRHDTYTEPRLRNEEESADLAS